MMIGASIARIEPLAAPYLTLMFFKIGAFVLIFQTSVFANENLTQMERIGLVIPLFLFLITEAIAVSKLLNSK